jgi:hypothetical protein
MVGWAVAIFFHVTASTPPVDLISSDIPPDVFHKVCSPMLFFQSLDTVCVLNVILVPCKFVAEQSIFPEALVR